MLSLRDFFHLPQLDDSLTQIAADGPGLILVAGPEPRPGLVASGRSAFFQILLEALLEQDPELSCLVVNEGGNAIRVPRGLKKRVKVLPPVATGPEQIEKALERAGEYNARLLVVEHLDSESAPAALHAARQGLRVLAQMDTIFWGGDVVRDLLDQGTPPADLAALRWIVAVQRAPALCPHCRQRVGLDGEPLVEDFPPGMSILELDDAARPRYQAVGCERCRRTGYQGDVAIFDVLHLPSDLTQNSPLTRSTASALCQRPSLLPASTYLQHLAALGYLTPDDCDAFERRLFHRLFHLLKEQERSLAEVKRRHERRSAELESAARVMEQRTRSLIALQDLGQALTSSIDLNGLAERICDSARELCGADYAILYYLRSPEEAEVLAVVGWEAALLHQRLEPRAVFVGGVSNGSLPFHHPPPGVLPHIPLLAGVVLRAGLYVPLLAQNQRVGLMIVHTTQKSSFTPGEASLLQTFAHQAALALQRAGLIEDLRTKITELEEAQAELVHKERLDHELELARQVQQSMLPRTFPQVPGYQFAAHNQPARQVGGDFYDVIRLDDEHFGVVIADVSDKGMPAALYMALTRSLLLAEARRSLSPQTVLRQVNRLLLELGEHTMFITLFYGVVDCTARTLNYSRAGHDLPYLLRGDQAITLEGKGVALGVVEPQAFLLAEKTVGLEPGDRLVLYTDGLTDVLAPGGQLFSRGHLRTVLQAHRHLAPEAMCAAIFADLQAFQGSAEQYDDMTLLVVGVD